ncbi:Na-Ca exchanger/integrin-beta [Cylindrospermum sp. NIES-4074]|nr:Na-Ca exchanger/integrin-beta [Cylindrospermum sp. NIES-4074]
MTIYTIGGFTWDSNNLVSGGSVINPTVGVTEGVVVALTSNLFSTSGVPLASQTVGAILNLLDFTGSTANNFAVLGEQPISGTVDNRAQIQLTWGGLGLANNTGNDFVVYENGNIDAPEGYAVAVRRASTGQFTNFLYKFSQSFDNSAVNTANDNDGVFATGFDLSSFGIGAGEQIDAIRIVNLIEVDKVSGADGQGFVNLTNPTGFTPLKASGGSLFAPGDLDPDITLVAALYNVQPLQPTLSVNNVSVTEGNSGTTNAQFTITLSAASTQQVSVNYTTANGTAFAGNDYNSTNGTLTFAPGETSKTVNVGVIGDLFNETNETFQLQLSNPTNTGIKTALGTATIIDNDALPSLTISSLSLAEGDSGTRNATFNVQLSSASGQPVTVSYGTTDGTALAGQDYTATSGILTFSPGTTLLTINVPILGDTTVEENETFTVNLGNANGATIVTNQGTGTILNDDTVAGPVGLNLTGTSGNDTLTGGSGDDIISGREGNDTINGGDGNDRLTGELGADILTGGLGADRFIYSSFGDSLFGTSTQDRIRDFNPGVGDRIFLNNLPSATFNAGIITAANLTAAVTAAYNDTDPTIAGSQALATNQAVFFSFGATAATRRTYVSVNDSNAGFNSGSDLFIEVTGLVGTLPTGALTTNDYFATNLVPN